MTWYAASLLIAYERSVDEGGPIRVEEQTYLIEADDELSARRLAIDIGLSEERSGSEGLSIGKAAVHARFAGIRRLVTTQNLVGNADEAPRHGCELTYSNYLVASAEDLKSLAQECDVDLTYLGEY